MVLPGPAVSVAPAIGDTALPRTVDAWSFGAFAHDALRPTGIMSLPSAGVPFAVTPLRALDPELRADLLVAALATGEAPVAADAGPATSADVAAVAQVSERKAKSGKPRLYRKHWRKPPGPWKVSRKVTWYGPGFYGNRTACGQRYTRYIVGVAHRTLPCGTLVQFTWGGQTAVAPVIDRGPYGPRTLVFDWSAWLACRVFKPDHTRNGCFTRADVKYRVVGKVNLKTWFKKRKAEHRKRH